MGLVPTSRSAPREISALSHIQTCYILQFHQTSSSASQPHSLSPAPNWSGTWDNSYMPCTLLCSLQRDKELLLLPDRASASAPPILLALPPTSHLWSYPRLDWCSPCICVISSDSPFILHPERRYPSLIPSDILPKQTLPMDNHYF